MSFRLLSLIAVLLVLTACGGGEDQAGAAADSGTEGSATATDGGAHMGDHAGAEPTDFAFGHPADAADADRAVEIHTSDELAFDPAEVTVAQGETVTFTVTNDGDLAHDFVIGDDAAQEEHALEMSEMAAEGEEGEEHRDANAVSVPAGETVELTWTFDGEAEELRYGCHVPGHYEAGMAGDIVVEG
jgi:uncharacterized cupredoxin-like copper-binding protein